MISIVCVCGCLINYKLTESRGILIIGNIYLNRYSFYIFLFCKTPDFNNPLWTNVSGLNTANPFSKIKYFKISKFLFGVNL